MSETHPGESTSPTLGTHKSRVASAGQARPIDVPNEST